MIINFDQGVSCHIDLLNVRRNKVICQKLIEPKRVKKNYFVENNCAKKFIIESEAFIRGTLIGIYFGQNKFEKDILNSQKTKLILYYKFLAQKKKNLWNNRQKAYSINFSTRLPKI